MTCHTIQILRLAVASRGENQTKSPMIELVRLIARDAARTWAERATNPPLQSKE